MSYSKNLGRLESIIAYINIISSYNLLLYLLYKPILFEKNILIKNIYNKYYQYFFV